MTRSQILMLGSGTPNAEPDRAGPAVAVAVDNQPYLIDCGHGVVQRVVEANAQGIINWSTTALTRLFVTHLHADHTVGLPDLIFTPWIHGREDPIHAYGPVGLRPMLNHIQAAYAINTAEHLSAHPVTADGYKVEVTPVCAGLCYEDERVRVFALAADHGDLEAWSYKFETPDRRVVISGDTKPVPGFASWARGCDILIHEVYSSRRFPERSLEWQAYHKRVHTSADELAALANELRPGLLVLTHQLFWGGTPDDLVAEIKANYDGAVVSAVDLDLY